METTQSFGEQLREGRLAAGLTQEALAERAGVSARGIQALEGSESKPQRETARRLAAALGLPASAHPAFLAAAGPAPRRRTVAAPEAPAAPLPPTVGPPDLGSRPPLVGRQREVAALEAHLAGKGPPLLLFAGEPGIGKTRLLQEAAPRAIPRGWAVLAGGCSRGTGEPFAPLLQALERHVASRAVAALRAELAGCAWLVRLLPDLPADAIEPLPHWVLQPEQERHLLFKSVSRFLTNLAGAAGTLLLLDDLQWAGADACDLLASLLRQPQDVPLRLVGAYRDTDVGPAHPLVLALAELGEAQLATEHTLGPLAPAEAQALFLQALGEPGQDSEALAAQVASRAAGVPFYLVSYARSVQSRQTEGPTAPGVPWDLRQSIRRRVQALPEATRTLLGTAAVLGRVVPRTRLLAVMGLPEGEVLDAVQHACRAGLLEETADDAYAFVHDLIREVVEADLALGRRRLLHQQVAEALERAPGKPPVEALAYHFREAGDAARAAIYLEQAGDQAAARFADTAAAERYRHLVACLEGLGGAEADLLRAREKLGIVLAWRLGQFGAALAVLDQAASMLRLAGDQAGMARVETLIAGIYGDRGPFPAGIARLQPIVATLESRGPSGELAKVYLRLANLHASNGQPDYALDYGSRGEKIARALSDQALLLWALTNHAYVCIMASRADEALRAAQEAAALAGPEDDEPWGILAWTLEERGETRGLMGALRGPYHQLAWIHEERGEYEQGRQAAEHMLAIAEGARDPAGIITAMSRLGLDAFLSGDWVAGRAYLERGLALADEMGFRDGFNYTGPRVDLGRLLHAAGAWDEAAQYFEAVLAVSGGTGERLHALIARALLAEREAVAGHPEAACARLLPLRDQPGQEERIVTQYVLPVLAWAQLEAGQIDQAAGTVREALERARRGTCRLAWAEDLRVQALVLLAQGCWDEAEQALAEGLALTRSMPYPHGEGRLLAVYGRLHLARGDAAAAPSLPGGRADYLPAAGGARGY